MERLKHFKETVRGKVRQYRRPLAAVGFAAAAVTSGAIAVDRIPTIQNSQPGTERSNDASADFVFYGGLSTLATVGEVKIVFDAAKSRKPSLVRKEQTSQG